MLFFASSMLLTLKKKRMEKNYTTLTKEELADLKGGEWVWDDETQSWIWEEEISGHGGECM